MPSYRRTVAELRRTNRNATWVLAGVVIDGAWHGVRGARRASIREIEAGNVTLAVLPDLIAPDDRAAARVARWLAEEAGFAATMARGRDPERIALPDEW